MLRLTVPSKRARKRRHRGPVVVEVRPPVQAGVEVHEGLEIRPSRERREPVPVDPDDLGRDALADLRLVPAVGQDDQAAVAVKIDEAGGDDLPGGIDRAAGVRRLGRVRCQDPQPLALDDHRSEATGCAGAIDDRAAADEQVDAVRHADDTSRPIGRPSAQLRERPAPRRPRACSGRVAAPSSGHGPGHASTASRDPQSRKPKAASMSQAGSPATTRSALATSPRTARLTRRCADVDLGRADAGVDPVDDAGQTRDRSTGGCPGGSRDG